MIKDFKKFLTESELKLDPSMKVGDTLRLNINAKEIVEMTITNIEDGKITVESAKPDYLDFDKDGNKKEPMKKALKDKEEDKDEVDESLDDILKLSGIKAITRESSDVSHNEVSENKGNMFATILKNAGVKVVKESDLNAKISEGIVKNIKQENTQSEPKPKANKKTFTMNEGKIIVDHKAYDLTLNNSKRTWTANIWSTKKVF